MRQMGNMGERGHMGWRNPWDREDIFHLMEGTNGTHGIEEKHLDRGDRMDRGNIFYGGDTWDGGNK